MGKEYGRRLAAMPRESKLALLRRSGVVLAVATALLASTLATVESASADARRVGTARNITLTAAAEQASVRRAFAQAAFDIGEAYFVTDRKFEPSLNGISVDHVPLAPVSDEWPLSQLVAHASRRTLATGDAMSSHLAAVLRDAGCSDDGSAAGVWRCGGKYRFRLPSLGPARNGALELEAAVRSVGTPISPFAVLSAAFETAQWRPAGVHPVAAESARQAAAQMRLRTRGIASPCHVTALWVLAAIFAEEPDIHLIGDGLWHRADRSVDLSSITLHAARRGCTAAAAAAEAKGVSTSMLDFWQPETALRISARAGGESARALGILTAGELRDRPPSLLAAWPLEADESSSGALAQPTAAHRACDTVTAVQPHSIVVRVHGIEVHPCLVSDLRSLIAAARADGILLWGWGWRSTHKTILLRQRYCPLPSRSSAGYWTALSLLPSGRCRPPVAIPTESRHEYGLAVDFTCGSKRASIGSRNSRCYRWLAANAHRYGLYNFDAEPWHWSIDGR